MTVSKTKSTIKAAKAGMKRDEQSARNAAKRGQEALANCHVRAHTPDSLPVETEE